MSILNRPGDGVYSVLIVLYKCLSVNKQLSRDDLLRLCAPESISDQDMAKKTLTRWLELGLFQKNEKDKIEISPEYQSKKRTIDVQEALDELPKIARKIVFLEENNKNFWASEENKSADFTRALCWLLAQDVYSLPSINYNSIAEVESKQFSEASKRRPLQNDTRWGGFKAWATYLGFAWEADTFQIDPTVAIRDNLRGVFNSKKKLPQEDFLTLLKEILPVIDGGKYREKVEQELVSRHWKKRKDLELSTSLSRTLLRLNIDGLITLDFQSDAPSSVKLIGRNNRELRKVSYITLN